MILDTLFPRRCPVCGEVVRENFLLKGEKNIVPDNEKNLICPHCYLKLPFIEDPCCMKCGAPVENDGDEYCDRCRAAKDHFKMNRGMLEYDATAAEKLVWDIKYNNRREYADLIASELAARYSAYIKRSGCQAIVPVPIHPSRKRQRGYNQTEIIASRLGPLVGLPVDRDILFRIKKTKPQKDLTAAARYENLKKAFAADVYAGRYQNLMVLDDIFTTGTTLNCCALALRSAGVKNVYGLTACIVRRTV